MEDFPTFGGGAATSYEMARSASGSTNMGTVSPQELFLDQFMSAPNSTALTALTSPSVYEFSPAVPSYDVSPAFGSSDFDSVDTEQWTSLFPEEPTATGAVRQQSVAAEQQSMELAAELDAALTSGHRRKSSTTSLKTSTRHSVSGGVNARKRDKPLPPIVIDDPSDTVALKRARNTLAARKSRERKQARMEEYEQRIAELEAERDRYKALARAHGADV